MSNELLASFIVKFILHPGMISNAFFFIIDKIKSNRRYKKSMEVVKKLVAISLEFLFGLNCKRFKDHTWFKLWILREGKAALLCIDVHALLSFSLACSVGDSKWTYSYIGVHFYTCQVFILHVMVKCLAHTFGVCWIHSFASITWMKSIFDCIKCHLWAMAMAQTNNACIASCYYLLSM